MKKIYYAYVCYDPRRGKSNMPFYVGKGHGSRADIWLTINLAKVTNNFLRGVLSGCRNLGLTPKIKRTVTGPIQADAFALEIQLIAKYGRRDLGTGTLCNLTDGGDGAAGCLKNLENIQRLWADPKFRAKMRRIHADPVFKAKRLAGLRKLNDDPDFQAKRLAAIRECADDPEFIENRLEGIRQRETKRGFRARRRAALRKLHANPAFKRKQRASVCKLNADPKHQAKCTAGIRKRFNDPVFKAKHLRRLNTRQAVSNKLAALRKRNADPEFQAKRVAALRKAFRARRIARQQENRP